MIGSFTSATRIVGAAAALVFGVSVLTGTANATTERIVGQPGTSCPSARYSTIGSAIAAAAPGDQILICPATYDEQLVITKPVSLRGLVVNGVGRVLVQPSVLTPDVTGTEAVIAVLGTHVTIENLALDAGNNAVSGCAPGLAGVHFHDASGAVLDSSISGAKLTNPVGCAKGLPFGNGWGVFVDADVPGPFNVSLLRNSIHDYGANGVLAEDDGVKVTVDENDIVGQGPSGGAFQFGIFLANGAAGVITANSITEGNCGVLAIADCIPVRSEGITLRKIGAGTVVDGNSISNAQSGIFINGATGLRVTNNRISHIDALSGIDIQGTASGAFTGSRIEGNLIAHVGPIDPNASLDEEGCGINEYSGTGVSGNKIAGNTVNDAYCGVAHVSADYEEQDSFHDTLYTTLNSDSYPNAYPPAVEP